MDFFHYLSNQFLVRMTRNYTKIKLKQERWGHVKTSQRKEDFQRIELEVEGLVISINTHSSYLLSVINVNICSCFLKGDYYEVITLVNHLNFSHPNTCSPLSSSRWLNAILFLTRIALRYPIGHR